MFTIEVNLPFLFFWTCSSLTLSSFGQKKKKNPAIFKREEFQTNNTTSEGWGWWRNYIWDNHNSSEKGCTFLFSLASKWWPLAYWKCWAIVFTSSLGESTNYGNFNWNDILTAITVKMDKPHLLTSIFFPKNAGNMSIYYGASWYCIPWRIS